MLFQNAELFNVEELVSTPYGYRISRIPSHIREQMNETVRTRSAFAADGVEIRFVMQCEQVKIRFYVPEAKENDMIPLVLYFGNIQGGWLPWLNLKTLHQGINEIEVDRPKYEDRFPERAAPYNHVFDPCVVRVRLSASCQYLLGIDGDIRPPQPSELPTLHGICYGSSITHGSLAVLPNQMYVALCADALRADIRNLGFAGSCFLENAMGDYLAAQENLDFLVVELGTNLWGWMPEHQFAERITYLLDRFRETHPSTPVVLIDILTVKPEHEPCRILVRELIAARQDPNLRLLCGRDLLENEDSVSADFIHPSMEGQRKIAQNLAPVLKQMLKL